MRIGKQEATDEEIWKALEKAQLASHIVSLPDGLQTKMHEMGKRFSGGKDNGLLFARTLMQEAPIIVLDEPTIGLDPKTELSLIETMFSATEEKTVIWITHHLVGMEHVDEVIFLDRGQIVMQGSHEQLRKKMRSIVCFMELDKGI
ncbi:ATP-binding cassette domain-containing protein [Bacillus pacificus]